jgi:hypothetical protein
MGYPQREERPGPKLPGDRKLKQAASYGINQRIFVARCVPAYVGLVLYLIVHHPPTSSQPLEHNTRATTLRAKPVLALYGAPRARGLYLQDSASPRTEALVGLHDNIMYYLLANYLFWREYEQL